MKVGFTGTGVGMTADQKRQLLWYLSGLDLREFHHGDCVGADAEAHEIAQLLDARMIIIHLPDNDSKRAFCMSRYYMPAKPYLERNKDIVDSTDFLLACPRQFAEQTRSGTWATIRYARKQGKPVVIFWPDGTVKNFERLVEPPTPA
jgi:hypothetical protein